MSGKKTYFIMEVKRCITCPRFCAAIVGCFFVWYFSFQKIEMPENIYDIVSYIMYGGTSIIVLLHVVMAVPYTTGFCEDLETGYIRYLLIRGNLEKYVVSKMVVIYMSAMSVTVIAGFLFLLILNQHIPWVGANARDSAKLQWFMGQECYEIWFFFYFVQWGFWYGALAVIASFASIFITNRLLTWIIPALIHQIIVETNVFGLGNLSLFDIPIIFDAQNVDWGNRGSEFAWSCLLSLFIMYMMKHCIMRKLQQL